MPPSLGMKPQPPVPPAARPEQGSRQSPDTPSTKRSQPLGTHPSAEESSRPPLDPRFRSQRRRSQLRRSQPKGLQPKGSQRRKPESDCRELGSERWA